MLALLAQIGLATHVAALVLLYMLGSPAVRAALKTWQQRRTITPPEGSPRLALIVPLTGSTPGMERCLRSLLHQPGMDFDAWFAVQDEADPAAGLVRRLMAEHPRLKLVLCGPALISCQKNHSLLAALDALTEAGKDAPEGPPDILVFCDSTHEAAPDFLARLTTPLVQGRAILSTSYHRVLPKDDRPATLCHFYSALGIHLLQNLPLLCQPWGGATAILRREFLAHGVDAVWARGVVDDFTMGPYLQGRGVRALAVPEAALLTPVAGQTMGRWWDWWFRQLLYLKFCMPCEWLAGTVAALGLLGAWCWAAWDMAGGGIAGWLYLAALAGLGLAYGGLSQRKLPAWRRAACFLLMQGATLFCYLATWATNTLRWRGIAYRAGLDGTVRSIERSPFPSHGVPAPKPMERE